MSGTRILPDLDPVAIFGKSQSFVRKGLLRKESGDLEEYQLWASLALELLGKAALARIHPSLIADPTHFQSLFAASGRSVSTDIKTITAKTLFERLRHLCPVFDEKMKIFCDSIALRRNAELHSGAASFSAVRLEAWEAQYWHATQIILDFMDLSLDDWLGTAQAETPKAILKHAADAKRQAVTVRIERAREGFNSKTSKERKALLVEASTRRAYHYRKLFTLVGDAEWECVCPSCAAKAFLAGIQISEDVVDSYTDEGGAWESVEKIYMPEQFRCPVCDLFLDGMDEIQAAGMDVEHIETDEREMRYEEEYGND